LLCVGFLAASGCEAGLTLPTSPRFGNAGSAADRDAAPSDDPTHDSNPNGNGLIVGESDGGVTSDGDAGEPTCGASRIAAEQVVVEKVVEVPVQVTDYITTTTPVTVTTTIDVPVTTIKPTVLYIMLDQSQSMAGGLLYGANKWDPGVKGIKSFVNDPASAALSVALQ
jgi:hypothetical protein